MPRRRSFRRRGGFRRARSFIRRTVVSMGPIEAKRVLLNKVTIPDETAADWDNPVHIDFLVCQESVDEEVESDGSSIASVRPYSKLVGLKWNGYFTGPVDNALNVRWILYKMPDGESLVTSLTDGIFHGSNDDPTSRELRGLILAKGQMGLNQASGVSRLPLFVRRKTLRRIGNLRENDKIRLSLAIDGAPATNPTVSGFGTLYVRMN